eukprot:scaffold50547_cov33-Tisochrysis_lutea.AAC.1
MTPMRLVCLCFLLSNASAHSGLLQFLSHLPLPSLYKRTLDPHIDLMGCWAVELVAAGEYWTSQVFLEPSLLRNSAQGTAYFAVPIPPSAAISGLIEYHIEVHPAEGLLNLEPVWAAGASQAQQLAIYNAASVDQTDLSLNLAFLEDNGSFQFGVVHATTGTIHIFNRDYGNEFMMLVKVDPAMCGLTE